VSTTTSSTTVDFHDLRGRGTSVERIRDYRRVEVERMLLQRVPIRQMAAVLQVSTRTVQKDIKVVERWWRDSAITARSERVDRETKILDVLESEWLGRALRDPVALDGVLRIQAARAKLLGLNAPTQSQVEIVGDTDELRKRALEIVQDDLARRRELHARAAGNGAIDVASTEHTG
jgi:hypothetical protein